MENHQKRGQAAVALNEQSVIRPAAFARKQDQQEGKQKVWDEATAKAASDRYKESFAEQVAHDAMQAMLRVFSAAGLLPNLDGADVHQYLMTNEAVKAFACGALGVEHPFHSVAKKIILEPDDKTRSLVGYMIMSAEGSLSSSRDLIADEDQQGA